MRDDRDDAIPPISAQPDEGEDLAELEPRFDLRRGLRVLIIVGLIVMIISVICIGLDSRYQ
ncbi:MAG: hypothetical protein C4346_02735 [Chloroflexota bacterium]